MKNPFFEFTSQSSEQLARSFRELLKKLDVQTSRPPESSGMTTQQWRCILDGSVRFDLTDFINFCVAVDVPPSAALKFMFESLQKTKYKKKGDISREKKPTEGKENG